MVKNIPNILTTIRILLIPILITSFYIESKSARYVTVGIFLFASITDYIDGILARMWKAQTNFGRVLDPIADKMLVVTTLVMIVDQQMAPVIPVLAILSREILVSGMREYLAEIRVALPVTFLAKVKTMVQMLAIIIILLEGESFNIPHIEIIGVISLWTAAAFTVISGFIYFHKGMKHL